MNRLFQWFILIGTACASTIANSQQPDLNKVQEEMIQSIRVAIAQQENDSGKELQRMVSNRIFLCSVVYSLLSKEKVSRSKLTPQKKHYLEMMSATHQVYLSVASELHPDPPSVLKKQVKGLLSEFLHIQSDKLRVLRLMQNCGNFSDSNRVEAAVLEVALTSPR